MIARKLLLATESPLGFLEFKGSCLLLNIVIFDILLLNIIIFNIILLLLLLLLLLFLVADFN